MVRLDGFSESVVDRRLLAMRALLRSPAVYDNCLSIDGFILLSGVVLLGVCCLAWILHPWSYADEAGNID